MSVKSSQKVKVKSKSALLSILPHVPYIHTENWNCVTLFKSLLSTSFKMDEKKHLEVGKQYIWLLPNISNLNKYHLKPYDRFVCGRDSNVLKCYRTSSTKSISHIEYFLFLAAFDPFWSMNCCIEKVINVYELEKTWWWVNNDWEKGFFWVNKSLNTSFNLFFIWTVFFVSFVFCHQCVSQSIMRSS